MRREFVDQDSSHGAKCLLLSYVIASLIFCGGNVFGFTPLKQLWLAEGIYKDDCPDGTTAFPCEAQLARLDRMFTLAASLFSAWLLPAGLWLKYAGPRTCMTAGFALVWLGSLVLARASTEWYTFAYVLMGTGNPLLYISAFNFSKLYPESSNLLLSIFIGCFGFSSVVFYGFHRINEEYQLTSRQIFEGYSVLPIILGLIGLVVLPPDPYSVQYQKKLSSKAAEDEEKATEKTPLVPNQQQINTADATTNQATTTSTTTQIPLKQQSIPQQLLSAPFWAQSVFFCWGMLHQNFYLGTLGDQVFFIAGSSLQDQSTAAAILQRFSVAYPLGCLMAILPVGALVRHHSVSTSLYVYCTANLVFSTLSLVPRVKVQWITCDWYVVVRVGFFTVMSTYSSTVFGFANFSSLFGAVGALAGGCSLLGTFLNHRALYVDHSFAPVDTVLLVGAVLNFGFPCLVQRYRWED